MCRGSSESDITHTRMIPVVCGPLLMTELQRKGTMIGGVWASFDDGVTDRQTEQEEEEGRRVWGSQWIQYHTPS